MISTTIKTVGLCLIPLALSVGCASKIKKAELPEQINPSEEISRMETRIQTGYANQYDVLASQSFSEARSWLDEAKEDMADKKEKTEVREDLEYALAYMDQATEQANQRKKVVPSILEARMAAMNAGAKSHSDTARKIKKLDDRMRAASVDYFTSWSPDEIGKVQREYLKLEANSVQNKELNQARAQIETAKEAGAASRTPRVLQKAKVDLTTAENMIEAQPRNSSAYATEVEQANRSAQILTEVLAIAKENGPMTSEDVAIKLWQREQQIGSLEGNLQTVQSHLANVEENLETTEADLDQMSGVVSAQDRLIASKDSKINFQQAMDEVRKEFGEDEAEVYQQGDKLIIRLKKLQFASGKAQLPNSSAPLLAKVNDIIQRLGADSVVVEGHTDSMGSAKINKTLSQKRAQSVAQFLEKNGFIEDIQTKGYGFEKPLASNKTKEGRALNRRVDVVIEAKGANEASMQ